tara:strand:+ start:534 stop:833 length:300 start_codon:yes stop_codon:yes gene_type:complete
MGDNAMKFRKFDAVRNLVNGGLSAVNDNITYMDGQTPPSDAEIDAELKRMQDEYDAQEYARKREAEYPSIQECVHAILDDDLDAIQKKRAEIKKKYPKG